jgi:hypothetical protein
MKAGVYDIKPGVYYSDTLAKEPSLNGTVLKAFIGDSPLHGWTQHPKLNPEYVEKVASKFDLGSAVHALFLQGQDVTEQPETFQVDDEAVRAAILVSVEGKPFALITDADDWRTKAAKDVRDEARRRGLVPLLGEQWAQTRTVAEKIRAQLPAFHADPPLFVAGKAERTLVWRDRGVLCRARMDWLHDSLECCDDLKSTGRSANPRTWERTTMWAIGADIQAAFTLRGLRAALGVESTFRFILAETEPPYAISVITPGEQALALANAKIDVALEKWKRCLAEDRWPAYPLEVLTISPPPWMEQQWYDAQQFEAELAA